MELFVLAGLALPFALFAVLCVVRRARFRTLAAALGGTHVGANPFTPGAIRGEGFRIEVVKCGKAYRTLVRLDAPTPGTFVLRAEFFERFPDWRGARVPGVRRERVFLWEVSLPALAEPEREQQEALLAWLNPAARTGVAEALRTAKVGEIALADEHLSASLSGIVTDATRLRAALEALGRVASRDERTARALRRAS